MRKLNESLINHVHPSYKANESDTNSFSDESVPIGSFSFCYGISSTSYVLWKETHELLYVLCHAGVVGFSVFPHPAEGGRRDHHPSSSTPRLLVSPVEATSRNPQMPVFWDGSAPHPIANLLDALHDKLPSVGFFYLSVVSFLPTVDLTRPRSPQIVLSITMFLPTRRFRLCLLPVSKVLALRSIHPYTLFGRPIYVLLEPGAWWAIFESHTWLYFLSTQPTLLMLTKSPSYFIR